MQSKVFWRERVPPEEPFTPALPRLTFILYSPSSTTLATKDEFCLLSTDNSGPLSRVHPFFKIDHNQRICFYSDHAPFLTGNQLSTFIF